MSRSLLLEKFTDEATNYLRKLHISSMILPCMLLVSSIGCCNLDLKYRLLKTGQIHLIKINGFFLDHILTHTYILTHICVQN